METEKNQELWKIAKKRVGFKKHFAMYLIMNTFFWFLWYFSEDEDKGSGFPWPIWPMLGWGIGMAFSYYDAYIYNGKNAVEKEYERLKNN